MMSKRFVNAASAAVAVALVPLWVAVALHTATPPTARTPGLVAEVDDGGLAFAQAQARYCQTLYASATSDSQRRDATACLAKANRAISWILAHPPATTPPPSTPPASPPPATAPPTTAPATTPPASTPPPAGGWPGPDNTGVPAGTVLTTYTGPCTLTAGMVIDARVINCDLTINVGTGLAGVLITRSQVNGVIDVANGGSGTTLRLTITASTINGGHRQVTGLGDGSFDAERVEVLGGNRGVLCAWRCTLRDSWVHGTYVESTWHASGVRAERYSTIVHNTLACDWLTPTAQDGGCSADLTGYPDFAAPHDWLIQGNLFVANPTGAAYCAYGGSSGGKPFSADPLTGVNIAFIDNVFQRGSNGGCGAYGPITSFNAAKAGALWSGNVWDTGGSVAPEL